MNIKLVVFDFDGVFTDGKTYVSENNILNKCYNCKDSYGLKLLNNLNIKTGIITADSSDILDNCIHIFSRLDFIKKGKYDKLPIIDEWINELKINYNNVAYIGDDLPDLPVLEKVGFSACPCDAIIEIKNTVDYVCKNKGGDGAVREFCDYIINNLI